MTKHKIEWIVKETDNFSSAELALLLNDNKDKLLQQVILDPDKGYVVIFGKREIDGK